MSYLYVRNIVASPEQLREGARYRVVFYVSRYDSSWYAVRNMGAYFSATQPPANIDSLDSYEPQLRWQGDFLTDSEGWIEVSGIFIAQGGEQFMTIGNFDGHYGTDTLFVPGGGQPKPWSADYWRMSGYYIDDVSVIDMSHTGIGETEEATMSIYPNPAEDFFTVETGQSGFGTLRLFDFMGREVFEVVMRSSKQNISVVGFPAGVYVAVVEQEGRAVARRKVIVE